MNGRKAKLMRKLAHKIKETDMDIVGYTTGEKYPPGSFMRIYKDLKKRKPYVLEKVRSLHER